MVRPKKSLFEKMSGVGRFIIGEYVTAKAIHILHLSECARCYGSDNITKRLVGLVVTNVNIPTDNVLKDNIHSNELAK